MGATGDMPVGSLAVIEQLINLSLGLSLLADSQLFAFLGKLGVIGKVAVGLGFVIFIHELGHFLAAKTFGVRCDKFYVGFDVPIKIGPIRLPSTLGRFQWGETEYGIGIIPLGGYVKMLGQDDDPRNAQTESEKIRSGDGPAAGLDPRSYPAKPVWQRMIIISAGVVMNLVSAIFLAAAAYYIGVPYSPSVVGGVNAGSPAWIAGLEPSDQVMRVGSGGEDNPNLRFSDLMTGVLIHGFRDKGQPLEVHVQRGESTVIVNPIPSPRYDPKGRAHLLGFTGERTTQLAIDADHLRGLKVDLRAGDRIIAVDGNPLPVDARFGEPIASELRSRLQARWNEPVQLTVERPAPPSDSGSSAPSTVPETFEVTLPPVPRNTLGVGFATGPVSAVREGSIGDKAGFQPGDVFLSIDDQPILDALILPQQFAQRAGSPVKFTVRRDSPGGSVEQEIVVDSPARPTFDNVSVIGSGELSLGGIGVAFTVEPEVSTVDPEIIGNQKVRPGDRLLQYRWSPSEEEREKAASLFNVKLLTESQVVDSFRNVASLMELLQDLPVGSNLDCFFEQDGKTVPVILPIRQDSQWFMTDERGLEFTGLTQVHRTSQLATALSLGFQETQRRFLEVLGFLRLLFTGQIGMGGVAGPVRLFDFAAQEATHGTSRLLIFLTLLSANLAILNFLPIPALDGGHMMFLTAEAIRGKPISEEIQIRLTMAGVLGLLALMAFVILKDIYSYVV
jgi:regulator of sigma E protease